VSARRLSTPALRRPINELTMASAFMSLQVMCGTTFRPAKRPCACIRLMTLAGSIFATPPGLWGNVSAASSNPAGMASAFSCRAWRNFSIGARLNPGPPVSSASTRNLLRSLSLSLKCTRSMQNSTARPFVVMP
jgi:hypothetical protein